MIRSLVRQAPRLLICVAMAAAVTVPAHGATITIQIVDPSNACSSFTMAGTTVTCNASGGGTPTAPSGCSLSGTAVPAGGGQTTLSVSCSSGGSPTSYAWRVIAGPTPSSGWTASAAGSQSPTIAATTTFGVTPSNGVGASNEVSTTVTVSPGGGGGGGGGSISCSGFTNTIVVDMDWNNQQRMLTGGINATDAVVVRFTTGPNNTSATITGAEFGGQQSPRVGLLSPNSCDFATPPQLGWGASVYGSTVYMPFTVGPGGGYYGALAPNTTYYVNVKTTGGCTSCGMYFDLHHN